MDKTWELKRALRDKAMRRELLQMLQEATQEKSGAHPARPEPMRDDEQIVDELHRILKIRRSWIRRFWLW